MNKAIFTGILTIIIFSIISTLYYKNPKQALKSIERYPAKHKSATRENTSTKVQYLKLKGYKGNSIEGGHSIILNPTK
ncbi:hypothetical protein [Clostridium felsineum]|uniref:hypothetical protein n=1 Tax=Clostridium felsineum TaxID=36839 RepID=UPI00098C7EC2|nr:hypothetical protein [Clostridium felsineum]URZ15876.1 hypothetical protein CLFE_019230 [Clostridium felsineum DSM 794]